MSQMCLHVEVNRGTGQCRQCGTYLPLTNDLGPSCFCIQCIKCEIEDFKIVADGAMLSDAMLKNWFIRRDKNPGFVSMMQDDQTRRLGERRSEGFNLAVYYLNRCYQL